MFTEGKLATTNTTFSGTTLTEWVPRSGVAGQKQPGSEDPSGMASNEHIFYNPNNSITTHTIILMVLKIKYSHF